MTRAELLKIVIGRARANGFEFRRWYAGRLGVPWISPSAAVALLESQRRYYALLFSHDFAEAFWKAGEDITFQVSAQTFQRTMPDGSVGIIKRKAFTRRSARKDAWKYHLREMALATDPLRYIRKYLNVEEQLDDDPTDADHLAFHPEKLAINSVLKKNSQVARKKKTPRPLPKDLPAFLKRPYTPRD